MKTKLDHLREFYNGRLYPLIVLVLAVLGNAIGQEFICYFLTTVTVFIGCIVAYDLRFALTPFICTVFYVSPITAPDVTGFRENYIKPFPIVMMVIVFSMIFVGVVIFAIRNRHRVNRFPWRGMFLSMVILCAALLLNGAFNPAYTWQNFLYACTFPLVLLILYAIFALYVNFEDGAFEYFMYALMIACTVVCLELVIRYLSGAVIVDGVIIKENVRLGWAVWTTIGGMIAMLMPASFYFAATHRHGWVYYLLGLFQFFCTVLSQSRGAMLIGGITLLICVAVLCFCGPNKRINRYLTAGLFLVGIVGVALLWARLIGLVQGFLNTGLDDNGRYDLWRLGFEKFVSHPIFGAGFYDNGIASEWDIQVFPYFYHNTVIQLLASTGIVGMAAYLWHRFYTVRAVLRRPSIYRAYLGICILSCLLFCMLDVMLFITYPMIFYTLIMLFIERDGDRSRERAADAEPLDFWNK